MTATTDASHIHLVRLYDAPLRAVWDAWTDPAQAAHWWGPRGFTLTTHSKDLRVGGTWNYTMHGPDGVDYPNTTVYFEVEPLAKLVYDHGGNADQPPMFRVTVLFDEVEGKTRMDMTMQFSSAEAARQARIFIKQAGGNATWDRLAEHLEQRASHRDCFVINRSFDAPQAALFAMWTQPDQLVRWIAPAGFTARFLHADIRPGGGTLFSMTGMGVTMYARAGYEEISPHHRIVYAQQFCDEHERVMRHPLAPTWPETMRITVDLHAEGEACTRVTLTTDVVGDATAEEMATFAAGRASMTMGWNAAFDQLDAVLAHA